MLESGAYTYAPRKGGQDEITLPHALNYYVQQKAEMETFRVTRGCQAVKVVVLKRDRRLAIRVGKWLLVRITYGYTGDFSLCLYGLREKTTEPKKLFTNSFFLQVVIITFSRLGVNQV